MAHPRKLPIDAKILQISLTQTIITHFVPNFVAMATGIGQGKMQIDSIQWSIPEPPPYRRKKSCGYLLTQAKL